MMRNVSVSVFLFLLLMMNVLDVPAAGTMIHSHESYQDFSKGKLKSTSLSASGRLTRAPKKNKLSEISANTILDIAKDKAGTIYLATGTEGTVFVLNTDDTVTTAGKTTETLITAIVLGPNDELFAAAAPGGNIYRMHPDKPETTPTLFCKTDEKYIWDMMLDKQGRILAATGSKGKVLRIDGSGAKETLLETDTENAMALLRNSKDELLVVTHKAPRVYRIDETGDQKPYVLYEGKLDEIRSIVEDSKGNLLLALNSGMTTGQYLTQLSNEQKKNASATPSGSSGMKPPGAATAIVVKIDPEGFASLHWKAEEAPIQSMVLDPNGLDLMIATGSEGKLYHIQENGDYSVLFSVDETMISSLLWDNERLLLGASDSAVLYETMDLDSGDGIFVSEVIDAGSPVKWGRLRWDGIDGKGSDVTIATRTGNTAKAEDDLWNPWTKEQNAGSGEISIISPVGRYIQYRLTITETQREGLEIEKVELFAREKNRPPIINEIKVTNTPSGNRPPSPESRPVDKNPAPGMNPATARMNAQNGSQANSGKNIDIKPHSNNGEKIIAWKAEDPNGDTLQSDVYFRGRNEKLWKLIESGVKGTNLKFPSENIPDGAYRIKVVVNDKLSNVYGQFGESELIGDLFQIDNTAPEIRQLEAINEKDNRFKISVVVSDSSSYIADALFSVDAGDWHRIEPVDQLFDSKEESIQFLTESLEKGEHVLTLLTTDSEGNTAVAKITLKN